VAEPIEHFGITLAQSLDIVKDCKRIYKQMGSQAAYPYHQFQMVRAMLTVFENYDPTAVSVEELTLWKRRWTAVNAQLQKYKKHAGKEIANDDATDVAEDA
jgi:hypothetical protein